MTFFLIWDEAISLSSVFFRFLASLGIYLLSGVCPPCGPVVYTSFVVGMSLWSPWQCEIFAQNKESLLLFFAPC